MARGGGGRCWRRGRRVRAAAPCALAPPHLPDGNRVWWSHTERKVADRFAFCPGALGGGAGVGERSYGSPGTAGRALWRGPPARARLWAHSTEPAKCCRERKYRYTHVQVHVLRYCSGRRGTCVSPSRLGRHSPASARGCSPHALRTPRWCPSFSPLCPPTGGTSQPGKKSAELPISLPRCHPCVSSPQAQEGGN